MSEKHVKLTVGAHTIQEGLTDEGIGRCRSEPTSLWVLGMPSFRPYKEVSTNASRSGSSFKASRIRSVADLRYVSCSHAMQGMSCRHEGWQSEERECRFLGLQRNAPKRLS